MSIDDLINRYPVEADYLRVLGFTTYAFSSMEWNAVNCCERMSPGYLNKVFDKQATAFNIAQKLVSLTKNLPESPEQKSLLASAEEFEALVSSDRNHLFHGYPATVSQKAVIARFSSEGSKVFELSELEEFAQNCHNCSSIFSNALYGLLAENQ